MAVWIHLPSLCVVSSVSTDPVCIWFICVLSIMESFFLSYMTECYSLQPDRYHDTSDNQIFILTVNFKQLRVV